MKDIPNIGKLDRRIQVSTVSKGIDQWGGTIISSTPWRTVWAAVEERLSPSAAFGKGELDGKPVLRRVAIFTFRNSGTPPDNFEISFNNKVWTPVQISEVGVRGAFVRVIAENFDSGANS